VTSAPPFRFAGNSDLIRRKRILALTVIVMVAFSAGCGGSQASPPAPHIEHLTLWLDYTPWGVHVPIYAAEALGYFARNGLSVSIRPPANVTDPLKLVAYSKRNTLAIGYMSDVVTAESQGIPVVSVAALVQHHLNCIMTLKRSGITSPRQLAGKRIGAAETPADTVILNTVFKKAGVSGRVQRVNVNYDYVPALLQGRVDAIEGAYQVWERIEIQQAGQRVNVIQLQKWGVPDEYELVLLASRSMINAQPQLIRRFMRALGEGETYAVTHPAGAVSLFLKLNRSYDTAKERTLVQRSWRLLIPFVKPPSVRFGSQSATRWHRLAVWMYRQHLVRHLVPTASLFTEKFPA